MLHTFSVNIYIDRALSHPATPFLYLFLCESMCVVIKQRQHNYNDWNENFIFQFMIRADEEEVKQF